MQDRDVILHLSLIIGVGPATITAIVDHMLDQKRALAELYQVTTSDLMHEYGLSAILAEVVFTGLQDKKLLETELRLIERHDIQWATVYEDHYPVLLRQIHLPPSVVYWMGEHICSAQPIIAIVGSRQVNRYGAQAIKKLVPELVHAGWLTVSGGARGADSLVHEATLDAGGKTVAVLGSGLLNWYPTTNDQLFKRIKDNGGTLMSSFPLEMEALAGNFPARNRIISGLSYGCVVVQAALESGTRITAQYCLDQARELFAVPGPIDDPLSAGCHAIIQQGAKLVVSTDDIIEEFNCAQFAPQQCNYCSRLPEQSKQKKGTKTTSVTIPSNKTDKPGSTNTEKTIIDPISQAIIASCRVPQSTDALIALTGCSAQELSGIMFDLQLEGKIMQNRGMWQAD